MAAAAFKRARLVSGQLWTLLQRRAKDRSHYSNIQDKYDIGVVLGAGAFGRVRKARERATGDLFAIKSIKKGRGAEYDLVVKSLQAEQNTLKSISHPNVRRLVETAEDADEFHVVTDLCEGGELFERISGRGYLCEHEAGALIEQVLEACRALHSQNIIHRDVKPENLLFKTERKERDGPVDWRGLVLVDFGMAVRLRNEGDTLKTLIGTPYYLSPEVIKGQGYGSKTDVWSCGAVLCGFRDGIVIAYCNCTKLTETSFGRDRRCAPSHARVQTDAMLSGFPPYLGENVDDTLDKISAGDGASFAHEEWDEVSAAGTEFCRLLLERDANARPTAAEALQHPWLKEQREINRALRREWREGKGGEEFVGEARGGEEARDGGDSGSGGGGSGVGGGGSADTEGDSSKLQRSLSSLVPGRLRELSRRGGE